MIICINCGNSTKDKMDELLSKDHYRDYSELIAVAVDNLWMLEREVAEKGAFVLGEEPIHQAKPHSSASTRKNVPRKTGKTKKSLPSSAPAHIPDLFLIDGLADLSIKAEKAQPHENPEETYTLDNWIFGQYNKLLPLKANCRAISRFTAENSDGMPLHEIALKVSEEAALLGDYLADHDRRNQTGRDNALATAFPRSGSDAEKGRARYANQFIGSVTSQGALLGFLSDYRFASLSLNENALLRPTEPAVDFARLTNPVFDGSPDKPQQKFSEEEVAFLINHIRTFVPVEHFTFRTLTQSIIDGADTPDKLDEALRTFVPTDTGRSLSQSFLTSQRSGALSRMVDLGLVIRQRNGVKVTYKVGKKGHEFIESN